MSEDILFDEQIHEIPPGEILHDEVEVVRVLEGALEANDPRVFLRVGKYIPLFPRLHDFVFEDHLAFLQLLDGHGFGGLVPPAEPHLAESSLADDSHRLEVIDRDFLPLLPQLKRLLVGDLLLEFLLLELRES